MGVSLTYQTTKPVSASARKTILADAERLNRERAWWCENLSFFEIGGRKKKCLTPLVGDTKLFRVDADEDEDEFMGYRDAAFIVQQLVSWSLEHGVDWQLEIEGTEVGTITNGEVEPPGLFQWDQPETVPDRRRAARIVRKYAARDG